jgi:hypothetical protein
MRRFSLLLFFSLLLACVAFIVGTFEQLPRRVASHFGSGGESNAWMRRDYTILDANSTVPARMPASLLRVVGGGFIAATLAWQALFWLRFRTPKVT